MTDESQYTKDLLQRWNRGDKTALKGILEQNLAWVQAYVRKRLGPNLRRKAETNDIVQEAMMEFLRHGPRFVLSDTARLRGLLARIVENTLGHHYEWFTAKRRAMHRERPLPSDSILHLDTGRTDPTPSQHAQENEREAWVRLGLELLGHDDREIILLRIWDNLSFAQIATRYESTEDAVRMRFHRAVHRMGQEIRSLRGHDRDVTGELLGETP